MKTGNFQKSKMQPSNQECSLSKSIFNKMKTGNFQKSKMQPSNQECSLSKSIFNKMKTGNFQKSRRFLAFKFQEKI
ncbi:MAG: hypothetical protein KJ559_01465 [Nanoarchaeota archaeon]|nr:hypothetical protein [Nanoarchaeota archaeon]